MPRADNPHLHAVISWARPGRSQLFNLLRLIQRFGLGRIVRRDRLTDYYEVDLADVRFPDRRNLVFQYDGEVRVLEARESPMRAVYLPLPDRLETGRSVRERGFARYLWSLVNPVKERIDPPTGDRPTRHRFVLPFFGDRDEA